MRRSVTAPSEIERAVSAVRAVLAALTAVLIVGEEATSPGSRGGLTTPLLQVALVLLGAGVLGLVSTRAQRIGRSGEDLVRWLFHTVDTLWFVGVIFVFGSVKPETAWVILVVPVVVASLRLGYAAVIATWLIGAVAYAGAGRLETKLWTSLEELFDQLGILLAVAACIALLTRWLQQGWFAQATLTAEAERRNDRLSVIEDAAREMRKVGGAGILDVCLDSVARVGFDAATASVDGDVVSAAGTGDIVPDRASIAASPPDAIEVVHWLESSRLLQSVSIIEPASETIITGWAGHEIDDGLAQSLAELVANATNSMEAADHLDRARFGASHDHLTGLFNRAELDARLEATTAPPTPVAVIFIDLDHFKPVNDSHGHLVGDQVLVALAGRIATAADLTVGGDRSVVARYGGDEFVVLLPRVDLRAALDTAERIRAAADEPFAVGELELSITASIGVAAGRPNTATAAALLMKRADDAALRAKETGRNQVCMAPVGRLIGGSARRSATSSSRS